MSENLRVATLKGEHFDGGEEPAAECDTRLNEKELLLKNKNVKTVTSTAIIYQDFFKQEAINLYILHLLENENNIGKLNYNVL